MLCEVPLTKEQQEFAAEHHGLVYKFLFQPTPPFERAALGNPHDLGTPFPSSQSRLPAPSRFITHFKSVFQPTRPFRAVNKQPIDPRICYEFQPTPSTRRVTCLVVSFFCLTGSFQPTPSA